VLKISKPIPRRRWCLGLRMQVDYSLLHGLKYLFKSRQRGWWRVGILVVVVLPIVLGIIGGDTAPCVGLLKYEH
jgi:hypothetical protein